MKLNEILRTTFTASFCDYLENLNLSGSIQILYVIRYVHTHSITFEIVIFRTRFNIKSERLYDSKLFKSKSNANKMTFL